MAGDSQPINQTLSPTGIHSWRLKGLPLLRLCYSTSNKRLDRGNSEVCHAVKCVTFTVSIKMELAISQWCWPINIVFFYLIIVPFIWRGAPGFKGTELFSDAKRINERQSRQGNTWVVLTKERNIQTYTLELVSLSKFNKHCRHKN